MYNDLTLAVSMSVGGFVTRRCHDKHLCLSFCIFWATQSRLPDWEPTHDMFTNYTYSSSNSSSSGSRSSRSNTCSSSSSISSSNTLQNLFVFFHLEFYMHVKCDIL